MVNVNSAFNKIANVVGDAMGTGEWGTGTTTPTVTDTDLETPVVGTSYSLDKTISGQSLQLTHTLPSTAGNGNTLTEFGTKFTDTTLFNHVLIGGIAKTSNVELIAVVSQTFKNG